MTKKYTIIVTGITQDFDINNVSKQFSQLFKVDENKALNMLSRKSVIKKECDEKTAIRYKNTLEKIGVKCHIKELCTNDKDNTSTISTPSSDIVSVNPKKTIMKQGEFDEKYGNIQKMPVNLSTFQQKFKEVYIKIQIYLKQKINHYEEYGNIQRISVHLSSFRQKFKEIYTKVQIYLKQKVNHQVDKNLIVINCPHCSKEVEKNTEKCPHCKEPFAKEKLLPNRLSRFVGYAILFLVLYFVANIFIDSGTESDVQDAVRKSLKDPDSAKFGEFTLVHKNGACIWVNARNSLGGYTGEQMATLIRFKDNSEWYVLGIDKDFTLEECKRIVMSKEK